MSLSLVGCNGVNTPDSPLDAAAATLSGIVPSNNPDFRLPARVTLCGEEFDLKRQSVYERLESEFLRLVNHPSQAAFWQRRAAVFFPHIEKELKAAGLPDDLKYLAVAESDLRPWIAAPAGAVGLWQFMPATARHYELTVNKKIDERHLPEPLLTAALNYFRNLQARFGTWSLALAAYNAGEGRIGKALETQKVNSYFDLDLPRETERYVYRIAAIKVVMENAGHYGLSRSVPLKRYQNQQFVERRVNVPKGGKVTWAKLAQQLKCDYKTLRLLNPQIQEAQLTAGSYLLRVPTTSR